MIELFSKTPNLIPTPKGSTITTIPADENVSSLSAILLNDDYYNWIQTGREGIDGIYMIGAEYLIPLKACAWLDLTARKQAGEKIDSKKISKHSNDILRLYQILDLTKELDVPELIATDMENFLIELANQEIDLKNFSLQQISLEQIVTDIRQLYSL